MTDEKEELHHDENTLKKVYEALLKVGIYGQQAVDAVSEMQNMGIFFRERKPKRRGRPPKDRQKEIEKTLKDAKTEELEADLNSVEDAWSPNPAEVEN